MSSSLKSKNSPDKTLTGTSFEKSKDMSGDFIIFYKAGTKRRLTVVITKKIAQKAVSRNRIKRLIREIVRNINIEGDLKIIVKQDLSGLKLADVAKKLEPQIKKLI